MNVQTLDLINKRLYYILLYESSLKYGKNAYKDNKMLEKKSQNKIMQVRGRRYHKRNATDGKCCNFIH
jgi:hypothetical protein